MESVTRSLTIEEAPLKPRTIYSIYVRAIKVEQRASEHWWVHFDGSWESIRFGVEKPWDEGDMVKITFEKVIQNG